MVNYVIYRTTPSDVKAESAPESTPAETDAQAGQQDGGLPYAEEQQAGGATGYMPFQARPRVVQLVGATNTLQTSLLPEKHVQRVFDIDTEGYESFRFQLDVAAPEYSECAGLAYIDRRGTVLEVDAERHTTDPVCLSGFRWQVPFSSQRPLDVALRGVEGVWQVVVYLFADAEALTASLSLGVEVAQHRDLQEPWQVCSQSQSGLELQELLVQWFDARVERAVQSVSAELRDPAGRTPLHHACMMCPKGAVPLISILLHRMGRDAARSRDTQGRTALHYAVSGTYGEGGFSNAEYERAHSIVCLLEEAGVPLDAADSSGNTALHLAARDDVEPCRIVKTLLQRGALFCVNSKGETPLSMARLCSALHTAAVLELWKGSERADQCAVKADAFDPSIASHGITESQLRTAFSAFDKNNIGFIPFGDFKHLEQRFINEYGIGVGSNLIQSTISKYDLLVDGLLSYEAFSMLMLKIPQI